MTEANGNVSGLHTVESGGSETEWFPSSAIVGNHKVFVLPSRRYFNPFFGKSIATRDNYMTSYESPPNRGASLAQFPYRLFQA